MNRRHGVWVATLFGSGIVMCAVASAQVPPGVGGPIGPAPAAPATAPSGAAAVPELPPATRNLTDATPMPAEKATINAFISAELNFLVSPAPDQQRIARDKLISAVVPQGLANGVTEQFLDAYAAALDIQIQAILKTNPPIRDKVLLGVVAATVAEKSHNTFRLDGTAQMLLNDHSPAAALWGMKTAKYVLPQLLSINPQPKLLRLIVDTAIKYPGPVLGEAYSALSLDAMGINAYPKKAKESAAQIVIVLPFVQELLASRVASYNQGLPIDPIMDSLGSLFLSNSAVWADQTPKQQQVSVHLMHDLLSDAGSAFQNADDDTKVDLIELLRRVAGALKVVVGSDPGVEPAIGPVQRLNSHMTYDKVQIAVTTLANAVQNLSIMQGVGPTTRSTSGAFSAPSLVETK